MEVGGPSPGGRGEMEDPHPRPPGRGGPNRLSLGERPARASAAGEGSPTLALWERGPRKRRVRGVGRVPTLAPWERVPRKRGG